MVPPRAGRAPAPGNGLLRSRARSPSTGSMPSDEFHLGGNGAPEGDGPEMPAFRAEYDQSSPGDEDFEDDESMREDANIVQQDLADLPNQLPPRGLKEISSLASWTVSTSKPGCGVAALRNPDTSLFWQSDGPQPHLLSIHFFKLVSISHIRIFLDFLNDESYTPTKIQFFAGYGVYDVIEFAEMSFEQPRGWIDVDFSMVGPIADDDEEHEENGVRVIDWDKRPVLRCFLLQVKILENHQNGKDTHLRGLQIFAKDERAEEAQEREESPDDEIGQPAEMPERPKVAKHRSDAPRIKKASWMLDPELR